MFAYVTLLSSPNYIDGVIVLNESLKRTKTKFPFYCILTQDITIEIIKILEECQIKYIKLNRKVHDGCVSSNVDRGSWDFSNWNYTFDKIQIWGLSQFTKVIYVDSDMIVVNNIDHLFEYKSFTASLAGKLFPTNNDIKILNSGLVVIEPNKEIETKMFAIAEELIPKMQQKNLPLGDQDIINAYFVDWYSNKDLILDDGYNLYAHYLQYYIRHEGYSFKRKVSRKPIYVIHFVGKEKPWMLTNIKRYFTMCKRMYPNVFYMVACLYYNWYLKSIKYY